MINKLKLQYYYILILIQSKITKIKIVKQSPEESGEIIPYWSDKTNNFKINIKLYNLIYKYNFVLNNTDVNRTYII